MSEPTFLDASRDYVRGFMRKVARVLNKVSRGKITPASITLTGLFAHVIIAMYIGSRHFVIAGLLLIVFGLFDALDGELARLQHKESSAGMLLDASTDRMKEILLYMGIAYAFIAMDRSGWAVWAVAASGASILVSYVKAKGETALSGKKLEPNEVNRLFADGFMRFEIRMTILVVALLINKVDVALVVITVLSWWTAMNRLMTISEKLG